MLLLMIRTDRWLEYQNLKYIRLTRCFDTIRYLILLNNSDRSLAEICLALLDLNKILLVVSIIQTERWLILP
jgi:hypothetical protein